MSAEESVAADETADEEHQPTGTMVVALLFLLVTAAVWVLTYVTLLQRG